jgi:hypothetical protein
MSTVSNSAYALGSPVITILNPMIRSISDDAPSKAEARISGEDVRWRRQLFAIVAESVQECDALATLQRLTPCNSCN